MENIRNKVRPMLNIAGPAVSGLGTISGIISPVFLSIPVVISVYNEVCGWMDTKNTEKRLHKLEVALKNMNIEIESFRDRVNALEEHDQYVVRNNIKYLCVSAIPETTDALIDCIIDFIMKEEQHEMTEEILEILGDFNSNDIHLMSVIKCYKKEKPKADSDKVWSTTWKDFSLACFEFSDPINATKLLVNKGESEGYKYASFVRSLLKMQRLGVVNIYVPTTLGSICQNNIESFETTVFGEKLLEHIK